jgi:hypothetical protein
MTEPIASPSSPINAKTQKTQRKHKGKSKVVSPNSATVDRTTPAASHTTSQGSSRPAASSDHDSDGIIESGDYYGDFDYDAVKSDDGVELWLVRAPSTVRPQRVESRCFLFSSSLRSFVPPNPNLPAVAESEELARHRD